MPERDRETAMLVRVPGRVRVRALLWRTRVTT